MDLREATDDDLDALADRWYDLATAMERYDETNELALDGPGEAVVEAFRAHLDEEDVTDHRLVHGGETIGFCTLREERRPFRTRSRSLRIVNLAVDEGHRGRGHGSAVVDRVTELARERGFDTVAVGCEWDNEGARRFYEGAGFRSKRVEYVRSVE